MPERPILVSPATLRHCLDLLSRAADTAGFVLDELPLFVAKYAITPRVADCWRQDYEREIVAYRRQSKQIERLLERNQCDNTQ